MEIDFEEWHILREWAGILKIYELKMKIEMDEEKIESVGNRQNKEL